MTKYAGRGIVVSFEGNPLGQLTAFGEVGSSRDLIDASAYGDDWKDYVLGQQDGVEVTGVVALDQTVASHQAMVDAFNDDPDATVSMNLTHTAAAVDLDLTGRLTQLTRGGELGGLLQMSFTLKIVDPGVVEGS
jgi:hypothetical protein